MKAKMKPAIVVLALTMGICLLFPSVTTAQEGMPCTSDPVDMFIMYGNLITCSLDQPGIVDLYRFNGTAGQQIIIAADGSNTAPCVELVGVTTACTGNNSNWVGAVLPVTQEYTIRVYDYYSSGTGNYTLDLESVVPPSPNGRQTNYGGYLTDQINPAGDLDVIFFTASVNDVVDVLAHSGTTAPCITLYAPDTKTSWSACTSNNSNELRTKALTVAGTYSILVYDYYYNGNGAYSVNLDCLSGPCVVTPIPDVSGYISVKGTPLAGTGVSLTQPGAPGPQLTLTDNNGYYKFLHIISGQTFNVFIHGPASDDSGKPPSGDAASAGMVDGDPSH